MRRGKYKTDPQSEKTNYDRIKEMTPKEMAFFLMGINQRRNENGVIIQTIDRTQMYDDKDCYFWLMRREQATDEQTAEKETV